jgi:hypothetical protein
MPIMLWLIVSLVSSFHFNIQFNYFFLSKIFSQEYTCSFSIKLWKHMYEEYTKELTSPPNMKKVLIKYYQLYTVILLLLLFAIVMNSVRCLTQCLVWSSSLPTDSCFCVYWHQEKNVFPNFTCKWVYSCNVLANEN